MHLREETEEAFISRDRLNRARESASTASCLLNWVCDKRRERQGKGWGMTYRMAGRVGHWQLVVVVSRWCIVVLLLSGLNLFSCTLHCVVVSGQRALSSAAECQV